jgi:ribosomal protein S18 acetylase RimI-like enzyme
MTVTLSEEISLKNTPKFPGLKFRRFRGEADYPEMLAITKYCREADDIQYSTTLEEIENQYKHLVNCNPYEDMIFAEVNGQVIGYGRVFWEKLSEGLRVYSSFCNLHPEWRQKGIGTAMLLYNQSRQCQIAAEHPREEPRYHQAWAADTEPGSMALLESQGYEPARHEFDMVRDLDEPFPETPLPEGLEVRPVKPEHIRQVISAADEAFKDHWGYRPISEKEIDGWMKDPNFRPELWKVAWDGDQIAGSVQNFYSPEENKKYNRKRGYTEGISTRRPWRKRGLASALIVQSMKMFRSMGMTETAHGVDSQNTSGALRLYKRLGYKVVKRYTTYRKPMG